MTSLSESGLTEGSEEPALSAMASRLSDALSHQCIFARWDELDEGDKQSLLSVCEWLLNAPELLEAARAERQRSTIASGEEHNDAE